MKIEVAVLAAAATLAMGACQPEREGPPPDLEMTIDGDVVAAEVQGYCVEGQCVDVEPRLAVRVEIDAGPQEAEFEWEWGSADASFALCRGLTFEDCDEVTSLDAPLDEGMEVDLEVGLYRLSVFLTWDQGNDAAYHFAIDTRLS